jgi:hypothetical protein
MLRKPCIVLALVGAAFLTAADPPWTGKRVAEWTPTDALQVLSDSPWAKSAAPTILPALTAFARRDGGNIGAQGGGQGMQLDRIPQALNPLGNRGAQVRPGQGPETRVAKLPIRWETALPIRAAEVKANDEGAPAIDGEDYAIAIYDISFKLASIDKDQKKDLAKELKKISALKIEGRPEKSSEFRPTRVSVIELENETAIVVYFFPRSARLTVEDKRVEFDAQVGRIAVALYFYPPEMLFQGKLEL